MSYIVSITKKAEEDLRNIYTYIMFELLSPSNARSQITRIQKAIKSLEEFPKRYPLMENVLWKARGFRIMPCDNFLIIYLIKDENNVIVSRILYGRCNVNNIL